MLVTFALVALGLVLLVAGGGSLPRGAVGLATLARLTPAVIGLTVVAAGASVPELAVSAVAALQGGVDVTVGNVVGSLGRLVDARRDRPAVRAHVHWL
jgi:cation:H+ antiporter